MVYFECVVELEGSREPLDQCGVDDGVHRDSVLLHVLEHLDRPLDFVVLHTRVDETAVGHVIWHQVVLLHLDEYEERVLQLVRLPVRLYQDPVCHCTRLYTLQLHLIKHCYCSVNIVESDAGINETVIEYFIRSDSLVLAHAF